MANKKVAAKMTMAQLKSAAQSGSPTEGASGKKEKTKAMARNAREMSLSSQPQRPRDQRRGSSVSPRTRLSRTQPTEMM